MKYRYVYRNAYTGRFCTKAWALKHPKNAVRERIGCK